MNQIDLEFQLAWSQLAHLVLTAGEAERMLSSLDGLVASDDLMDNVKHVQSAIDAGRAMPSAGPIPAPSTIESRLDTCRSFAGPPVGHALDEAI
ncbi:MAG: hypothetical protein VX589_10750 [Myxococcota bacterium]|nr:hypothetical protein [Myxococcota bacterium]